MDQAGSTTTARWRLASLVPSSPRGLLICTGLIVLGFLPVPRDWFFLSGEPQSFSGLGLLLGTAQLSALVCFGLALLVAAGARLPPLLARILAWSTLWVGLALSVLAAGFSGPGLNFVLVQGVLLSMALMGTLLWTARDRLAPFSRDLASSAVLVPAAAALGSLAHVAVVLVSAHAVAGGAPFCLARHDDDPAPVESVWELRWASFYTTYTGYKDSSRWYFHGLLTVETPQGSRIYNWSPRRMRFDPVDRPDIMLADPQDSCSPSPGFRQSL